MECGVNIPEEGMCVVGRNKPVSQDRFQLGSNQSVLVYDIETDSLDVDEAKIKFFGCYSFLTGEYERYTAKEFKDIKNRIENHKVLVGFNNKEFDNPILENNIGINFDYKVIVDLYHVSKMRLPNMGVRCPSFKLKDIIETLKLDDGGKGDIDYNIFKKDSWTTEEYKEIFKYTKQDVMLTVKLMQWFFEQFKPLRKYLNKKDRDNYADVKASTASLAYRVICNMAGLEAEFTNDGERSKHKIYGGHHIEPRKDRARGNIISVDFKCLHKDTIVNGSCGNIKISEVCVGDKILGVGGYQIIKHVNKKKVKKIKKITLDSGEIIYATGEHRFPVKYVGDKTVNKLCVGDELITRRGNIIKGLRLHRSCSFCKKDILIFNSKSHQKKVYCSIKCRMGDISGCNNPNYKGIMVDRKCICGNKIDKYYRKTCSVKCANKSKSHIPWNVGLTKHTDNRLMKLSQSKIGIKRNNTIKKKISIGTKKGMLKNWNRFITANKNRDTSFTNDPKWILKNTQSRINNIKKGKWIYNKINFRSGWEVIAAKLFDKYNIKWKYEPQIFTLKYNNNCLRYIPDFYLQEYNLWIEVKGFGYKESMFKYNLFAKNYNSMLLNDVEVFENEIQKIKNIKN